jgi:hypothetical protein
MKGGVVGTSMSMVARARRKCLVIVTHEKVCDRFEQVVQYRVVSRSYF